MCWVSLFCPWRLLGINQVFPYKLALPEWEVFKKIVVDGVYECGNQQAEHALVHVLQIILFVGNGVHVACMNGGLCFNIQGICCHFLGPDG